MSFLGGLFGDANERAIKPYRPVVEKINALEPEFEALSADALREKTAHFRDRLGAGETPDNLLPEAFAAVREASKRTLGQRHFDVQLMGGAALHEGKIAEMKTGEGKTLVATLPAYLNALAGLGVHIVTVNDYLSRRDAVWMGQIYNALGLTVGVLNHETSYLYDPTHGISNFQFPISNETQSPNGQNELDKERDTLGAFRVVHEFLRPVSRREAYRADITYGTNNEYGFDYLRDNMSYGLDQVAQREHAFAIVDEVDSILIDEARTPLIISAPDEESGELYKTFAGVAARLAAGEDYTVDEKLKAVVVTEHGIDKVESMLGVKMYESGLEAESMRLAHHLEQALKAHTLYLRDRDYVVREGEVMIVDEFTGRLMPGRRWSDGLHQAVEAKEGVEVQRESRTLATITFQNYFRMYRKLAGMTGTAATNAEEFHKVYKLDVVTIPTNRQNIRADKPDLVFRTEKGKFTALAREIKRLHEIGAPILIGTVSIEKNERLAEILKREGVPYEILNAKNHEKEAEIIAQAGKSGRVTVATNLAGRGVDIILGGNPQIVADAELVRSVGGLHVFGTERHEARRIDNQLRGRTGRQGDPGLTQFYLSLEDDLLRIFGSARIKRMMESFGIPEDEPIENRMVTKAIESAQAKIEGFHFDARKHVLEFDDVMNRQRDAIYRLRRSVLAAETNAPPESEIGRLIEEEAKNIARQHVTSESWREDIGDLKQYLKALFGENYPEAGFGALDEAATMTRDGAREHLHETLRGLFLKEYARKAEDLGEDFRRAERLILLQTIDFFWVEHLTHMDHLRDSVRLRAYGQRDPLVEYKNESVRLFRTLQETIRRAALDAIFKIGADAAGGSVPDPKRLTLTRAVSNARQNRGTAVAIQPGKKEPGRNDPCPCGSGKKYKRCHGA